jgi:hypothetical protein
VGPGRGRMWLMPLARICSTPAAYKEPDGATVSKFGLSACSFHRRDEVVASAEAAMPLHSFRRRSSAALAGERCSNSMASPTR